MDKENNNTVQVNTKKLQLATFAAGCFWGVEEAFQNIKGVKSRVWRLIIKKEFES